MYYTLRLLNFQLDPIVGTVLTGNGVSLGNGGNLVRSPERDFVRSFARDFRSLANEISFARSNEIFVRSRTRFRSSEVHTKISFEQNLKSRSTEENEITDFREETRLRIFGPISCNIWLLRLFRSFPATDL
jgi:ABC-type proline/glycine betaine transport system ATPase subunit